MAERADLEDQQGRRVAWWAAQHPHTGPSQEGESARRMVPGRDAEGMVQA